MTAPLPRRVGMAGQPLTREEVQQARRREGESTGDWMRRLRRQVLPHLQGEPLMISLAVAVGLATGLLASALIGTIALVQRVAWGTSVASWPLVLLVPTAGAFVVGLLLTYVAPESSGSGVIRVMTHLAMFEVDDEGNSATWGEHVTDEEYNAAPAT